MTYLFIVIGLFLIEILYFKIAEKYNIIDRPNLRSSHSEITLRGGGIIFYIGGLFFYVFSDFEYSWFFIGLTLMSIISFVDDILTLSNKIRLIVHFTSVLLMAYQLDIFLLPWYFLILTFILIVGVINAFNFMDGINGITACYSLAVSGLLIIVNYDIEFVDPKLLSYSMIALLVFSYFNFRNKAKTFAGDVGSVSIAYILLFCLGLLIFKTGNFIYILFLTVYGIDTVWTILQRLRFRQNIFEAHRSHLYQYLVNEARYNKLMVSFFYGLIQFIVGLGVIYLSAFELKTQIIFSILVLTIFSLVYLIFKYLIVKRYVF